jgi:hypothetical protein
MGNTVVSFEGRGSSLPRVLHALTSLRGTVRLSKLSGKPSVKRRDLRPSTDRPTRGMQDPKVHLVDSVILRYLKATADQSRLDERLVREDYL